MHTKLFRKYAKPVDYKLIHRAVYRYISLPFILIFIKLNIHPNFITFLSTIFRILGMGLYVTYIPVWAVVSYLFGYLMDWCDGPVSRATKKSTKIGAKLDKLTDALIDYSFYLAFPLGIYLHYKDPLILIVGFAYFTFMAIRKYIALNVNPNADAREKSYYSTQKVSNQDTYYLSISKIKSKSPLISRLFSMLIDFNRCVFPLMILFSLNIIFIFYFINIAVVMLRILIECYSTVKA